VRIFKKLNTLRTPTKNQLFNAKNPMSLRASSAEFLRSQPAGQPASQSGPLSALLSKENALKIYICLLVEIMVRKWGSFVNDVQ